MVCRLRCFVRIRVRCIYGSGYFASAPLVFHIFFVPTDRFVAPIHSGNPPLLQISVRVGGESAHGFAGEVVSICCDHGYHILCRTSRLRARFLITVPTNDTMLSLGNSRRNQENLPMRVGSIRGVCKDRCCNRNLDWNSGSFVESRVPSW